MSERQQIQIDTYLDKLLPMDNEVKKAIIKVLIGSLNHENRHGISEEWIPEKSAEELIAEIRGSRNFTRTVEDL